MSENQSNPIDSDILDLWRGRDSVFPVCAKRWAWVQESPGLVWLQVSTGRGSNFSTHAPDRKTAFARAAAFLDRF